MPAFAPLQDNVVDVPASIVVAARLTLVGAPVAVYVKQEAVEEAALLEYAPFVITFHLCSPPP